MFSFTLSMLQNALGHELIAWDAVLIKNSASPSQIYRVAPRSAGGTLPTIIVKVIEPNWPGDVHGEIREIQFYAEMGPRLGIAEPRVIYAGVPWGRRERLLILQDLSACRFPPPEHVWSFTEAECMVRAYARLHHHGARVIDETGVPDWFYPAYAQRLVEADIPSQSKEIVRTGLWPCELDLGRLYDETCAYAEKYAGRERTVLHNDVYPPNAGFLQDGSAGCVLIDWEMVGSGWAELDLAYMFTQPYRSSAKLDRDAVLSLYWQERKRLGGSVPKCSERATRQYYADALVALWLTQVAHRVAKAPFPRGSAPDRYWATMFGVLYRKLDVLCRMHG